MEGLKARQPKFIQPWVFPNVAGTGPVDVKSFGKELADRQRAPELRLKIAATRRADSYSPVAAGHQTTCAGPRRR